MAAPNLRWITPSLVAIAVALLGQVWHATGKLQDSMSDVRERLARVETALGVKSPAPKGVQLQPVADIQAASVP